jgi:hypothetical protein
MAGRSQRMRGPAPREAAEASAAGIEHYVSSATLAAFLAARSE